MLVLTVRNRLVTSSNTASRISNSRMANLTVSLTNKGLTTDSRIQAASQAITAAHTAKKINFFVSA